MTNIIKEINKIIIIIIIIIKGSDGVYVEKRRWK
jgi:hypothetical protein